MKSWLLYLACFSTLGTVSFVTNGCGRRSVEATANRPVRATTFEQAWETTIDTLLSLGYSPQSVSKEAQIVTTTLRERPRGGYGPSFYHPRDDKNPIQSTEAYRWRLVVRVQRDGPKKGRCVAIVQDLNVNLQGKWTKVRSAGEIEREFYDALNARLGGGAS